MIISQILSYIPVFSIFFLLSLESTFLSYVTTGINLIIATLFIYNNISSCFNDIVCQGQESHMLLTLFPVDIHTISLSQ